MDIPEFVFNRTFKLENVIGPLPCQFVRRSLSKPPGTCSVCKPLLERAWLAVSEVSQCHQTSFKALVLAVFTLWRILYSYSHVGGVAESCEFHHWWPGAGWPQVPEAVQKQSRIPHTCSFMSDHIHLDLEHPKHPKPYMIPNKSAVTGKLKPYQTLISLIPPVATCRFGESAATQRQPTAAMVRPAQLGQEPYISVSTNVWVWAEQFTSIFNSNWVAFMPIPILWVTYDVMNSLECMRSSVLLCLVIFFGYWLLLRHCHTPLMAPWKRETRNSIHMRCIYMCSTCVASIMWAIVQKHVWSKSNLISVVFALRGEICHVRSCPYWDGVLCTLDPKSQSIAQVLDLDTFDCYLSWFD